MDPLPVLPPNQSSDLGEGEREVYMSTLFPARLQIAPPPIGKSQLGEAGRGSNA